MSFTSARIPDGNDDTFDVDPPGLSAESSTRWLPLFEGPSEAREAVKHWLAGIDTMTWAGRSGATDKAVCEALGVAALERGGPVSTLGLQELAVYAGMHRRTALSATRRLEERRVLRRIASGGGTSAARWRLLFRETQIPGRYPQVWVSEDWARWRALGKTGGMVLTAALGRTESETVQHCGFVDRTVRRTLRRLEALRVLVKHEGTYVLGPGLKDCAAVFATDGFKARDLERLAQMREHEQQKRLTYRSGR